MKHTALWTAVHCERRARPQHEIYHKNDKTQDRLSDGKSGSYSNAIQRVRLPDCKPVTIESKDAPRRQLRKAKNHGSRQSETQMKRQALSHAS